MLPCQDWNTLGSGLSCFESIVWIKHSALDSIKSQMHFITNLGEQSLRDPIGPLYGQVMTLDYAAATMGPAYFWLVRLTSTQLKRNQVRRFNWGCRDQVDDRYRTGPTRVSHLNNSRGLFWWFIFKSWLTAALKPCHYHHFLRSTFFLSGQNIAVKL